MISYFLITIAKLTRDENMDYHQLGGFGRFLDVPLHSQNCIVIRNVSQVITKDRENICLYHISTNKVQGEFSRENMISSHVKIHELVFGHGLS